MIPALLLMLGVAAAGSWELVEQARSGEDFALPDAEQRLALAELCADLVRLAPMGAEPEGLDGRAEALGYRVERGEQRLWLVDTTGRGGVVLGIYLGPVEHELIVQAPHPFFDLRTGPILGQLFDEHPVRAALWTTAHRKDAPGSDAAHSPEGAFGAATQGLVDGLGHALVVQLHGFGKKEGRDAAAYVAGGRSWWRPEQLARARETLAARLGGVVVEPGGRSNGLGGRTNTQGRLLEGHAPVLLIELDRERRELLADDAQARSLLLRALEDVAADVSGVAR